jgi:hypothetical protein
LLSIDDTDVQIAKSYEKPIHSNKFKKLGFRYEVGYASRPVTFAGGWGLICPAFGTIKWFFSMGWQNSWNKLRGLRQMALAGEMPWSC